MPKELAKELSKELPKDVSSNEIWVNKFTEDSASKFRKDILDQKKTSDHSPIIIYIDSYGGYVDSLAQMIDTMDEFRLKYDMKFITVCMGKAMSCGAILLSHGDTRFCAPNSRVMVHEVSAGAFGDVHDVSNDAKETKRLNEHFLGILAENCNIKGGFKGLRQIIKDRDGRDIWMSAQESLDFGIVDFVGYPDIKTVISYDIVNLKDEGGPKKKKK